LLAKSALAAMKMLAPNPKLKVKLIHTEITISVFGGTRKPSIDMPYSSWSLPASQTRDKDALTEDGVGRVIAELRTKFDWVICDSPAGIERGATLAMRFADAAVIVANSEVSSVRDADRIIGLLDSKTVKVEKASAWRSTC
jgi:hypothetical protein